MSTSESVGMLLVFAISFCLLLLIVVSSVRVLFVISIFSEVQFLYLSIRMELYVLLQYGGGRTIRPGDALETPEDKAAKEAHSRQLIAAYKRKFGLNMDPKLKAECEKVCSEIKNIYIILTFFLA